MAERRFTDVELERSLAGDLPGERAAKLEAQATPADRARLTELAAEHSAFLETVDVDAEVRRIEQRAAKITPASRRPAFLRWLVPAGALVAAAAAVLVFIGRKPEPVRGIDEDILTKGDGVALVIHAAGTAESQRLHSGDRIAPGSRIRFEVEGTRRGFVAIVGIDGSGSTTVYYPFGATAATTFDPMAERVLPGAIALDATPGDETFFALFSTTPFELDRTFPALRGGIRLPDGITSSVVVLHKN